MGIYWKVDLCVFFGLTEMNFLQKGNKTDSTISNDNGGIGA